MSSRPLYDVSAEATDRDNTLPTVAIRQDTSLLGSSSIHRRTSYNSLDTLHVDPPEKLPVEQPPAQAPPATPNKPKKIPALDGGWGWMCVFGCSFMHFLLAGVGRSFSQIYVTMLERFDCTAAVGSAIGGVFTAVRMGCGPLISLLIKRFGIRCVTAVGAGVFSVGAFLCSFAMTPVHMFLTYSVLSGIGGAMVYFPAVVIVGQYFNKRRGTAMGISTAGSGLGALVMPLVYSVTLVEYGFFGTFVICAGVTSNLFICSAVYRPLEETWRGIKLTQRKKERLDSEAVLINGSVDRVGGKERSVPKDKLREVCQNGLPAYDEVPTIQSVTDGRLTLNGVNNVVSSEDLSSIMPLISSQAAPVRRVSIAPPTGPHEASQSTLSSTLSSLSSSTSSTSSSSPSEGAGKDALIIPSSQSNGEANGLMPNNGLMPINGTAEGSDTLPINTSNINIVGRIDFVMPASSTRSLPKNSVSSIPPPNKTLCGRFSESFGCFLLVSPAFTCFVIAMGLGTMAYIAAQNLIIAHALESGIAQQQSVYILAAIGVADAFGRLTSGQFFDIPVVRRRRTFLFTFILLGSGLSIVFWGICKNFVQFIALSVTNGILNGALTTGRPIVVADIVGIETMSQAFGLTVFSQGMFIVVGPYIAGHLRDVTGSYMASYLFLGISSCLAAALYLFGNRIGLRFDPLKRRRSSNLSEIN